MTPEGKLKLKNLLFNHEDYRQFPYKDTTGHLTIGIGRNLTDRGISLSESYYLLNEDIIYFSSKLYNVLPWFIDLDENRQIALIDMCFNLGLQGLLSFKKTLSLIAQGKHDEASIEVLKSKWATQVGDRAKMISQIIKTGEI